MFGSSNSVSDDEVPSFVYIFPPPGNLLLQTPRLQTVMMKFLRLVFHRILLWDRVKVIVRSLFRACIWYRQV
jgi:hypothetical protein